MTQEEKELVYKDLCARLPYEVIVDYSYNAFDVRKHEQECILDCDLLDTFISPRLDEEGEYIKPYLFPLSSMTEEQLYELKEVTDFKYNNNTLELVEWTETHRTLEFWLEEVPQYKVIEIFDWLNKNHFDYRCLIEKGLAIDATGKGIY